jgi:intracellular sulfur oxidation DsrE/DsrF family protein
MSTAFSRRAFFGTLTGLAAASPIAGQERSQASDLGWLDQFKGRHKQLFDLGSVELGDDTPLRLPNNYLNTFRDVLHAEPPDVNVAVGIARTAFPINASDALWQKYKIGEKWKIGDPSTSKPALRNVFFGAAANAPSPTMRSLLARGVVFWQCNIALGGIASQFARETGEKAEAVRAELTAGLVPGVRVVPAHSMAVGLAQERGFTYMRP